MSTCWGHDIDDMAGGSRVQTYLFHWGGAGFRGEQGHDVQNTKVVGVGGVFVNK